MKMIQLTVKFTLILLVLAAVDLQAGVPQVNGKRNFTVVLSGAQEVPPVETDAFGVFNLRANKNETRLNYVLTTVGLQEIIAAHIHIGEAGVNGPVAAFVFDSHGTPITRNGKLSRGVITSADLIGPLAGMTIADLLVHIRSGNAYINVHTIANPGGEIRAQIQ